MFNDYRLKSCILLRLVFCIVQEEALKSNPYAYYQSQHTTLSAFLDPTSLRSWDQFH